MSPSPTSTPCSDSFRYDMSERKFHKSPYSGTTVFAYYYDDLIKAIRRVELSSPVRNASTLMSQSRFRLGDQKFGDLREACLK